MSRHLPLPALHWRRCQWAAESGSRIAKVQSELGDWALFAKCMSNDGLIALAIDDAGPALAGLANDLLLASYGSFRNGVEPDTPWV